MAAREPPVSGEIGSDAPSPGTDTRSTIAAASFRTALEAGQVGIWSWDVATDRITWSPRLDNGSANGQGDPRAGTFSFSAQDFGTDEQPGVIAAIAETFRTSKPSRIEFRLGGDTGADDRWFEASATAIVENGKAARVLGVCRDVTDRLRVNREVLVRSRQQEALARLGERALAESDLQKFFEEVAVSVADILDVKLVKILELLPGDAELVLRAGIGWQPGSVGTAHETTGRASQAGYALAAGRPVIVEDLASETRFSGPQLLKDHGVVSGISTPIAGRDGRAYGVLGAHTTKRRKFTDYEVSFLAAVANVVAGAIQRRQLDQRQELMIRELRHRSGNLFSQLLALFSQTAKNSRNVGELVIKYEARVLALANAHRLITEGGWKSTSLRELLDKLLAPYVDRTSLQGPEVFLEPDPTFGLSMALHELVTNASKHGSLSEPAGRLELTWSVGRAGRGLTLTLDWKERGGPEPKRHRRPGFGSRMITMVIERQLNGEVQQSFAPQGLEARLIVPLTHERWPGGTARQAVDLP
jgi:two-component sensor histidine kinase